MIGGKKFKTLREAKKYEKANNIYTSSNHIYTMKRLHAKSVYKYFVGTHLEWLNL